MVDKDRVISLTDSACEDPSRVGGKAATLSRLKNRGHFYRVPWGYVITEPVSSILNLDGRKIPWAVRSSAVGEDGSSSSYAGMHDSILNVQGKANIKDAVNKVFDSVNSSRATAYRKAMGIDKAPKMCVLVQEQVQNVMMSGTAFSTHPVTGENKTVIEAEAGLGGVVDGRTIPTTVIVPNKNRDESAIDCKGLPELLVKQVLSLCDDLRASEGHPVDVEWCYGIKPNAWSGHGVSLLQCREITTVPVTGFTNDW